jgi:hypothetical protein
VQKYYYGFSKALGARQSQNVIVHSWVLVEDLLLVAVESIMRKGLCVAILLLRRRLPLFCKKGRSLVGRVVVVVVTMEEESVPSLPTMAVCARRQPSIRSASSSSGKMNV